VPLRRYRIMVYGDVTDDYGHIASRQRVMPVTSFYTDALTPWDAVTNWADKLAEEEAS
jgi:hypothetical protein